MMGMLGFFGKKDLTYRTFEKMGGRFFIDGHAGR